ncbi:MAG TPA: hypothetical protein VGC89_14250 [Pyrinomonadaceae bacterium]|jgi:hypothetical protein
MLKGIFAPAFALTCLLLTIMMLSPATVSSVNASSAVKTVRADGCPTSDKPCRVPVSSLGEHEGCECYACEAGTENQHIVCTKDEQKKMQLRTLIERKEENPISFFQPFSFGR